MVRGYRSPRGRARGGRSPPSGCHCRPRWSTDRRPRPGRTALTLAEGTTATASLPGDATTRPTLPTLTSSTTPRSGMLSVMSSMTPPLPRRCYSSSPSCRAALLTDQDLSLSFSTRSTSNHTSARSRQRPRR